MHNTQGLRDRHKDLNRFKNLRPQRGGFLYGFFNANHCADGEYLLRICPSDYKKNPFPDGVFIKSTMSIEMQNGKEHNYVCARSESYTNPSPDMMFLTMYVDGLLGQIEKLESEGKINRENWTEDLSRAVGKLSPWVRYELAILIWAVESKEKYIDEESGKEKTRTSYAPASSTEKPLPKIWSPDQETLSDKLFEIIDFLTNPTEEQIKLGAVPGPPPNDRFGGRMLVMERAKNRYDLRMPYGPSTLPEALMEEFCGDGYPALATMRDKYKRESRDVVSKLQNAWFRNELQQMGVNFTPPERPTGTVDLGSSMLTPAPSLGAGSVLGSAPAPTGLMGGGAALFGGTVPQNTLQAQPAPTPPATGGFSFGQLG